MLVGGGQRGKFPSFLQSAAYKTGNVFSGLLLLPQYPIMAIGVTSCDISNQWLTRDKDAHCKVIAVAVHLVATVLRGLLREYGIY